MKVILVEDEPSALRYLRSTLELRCGGCQVVATAENGAAGFEQVRRHRPDLVITDIRMAGMDGIQLAERIRAECPEVYSVIVSGYQDFEYARGALHSGVVDYLLKPVRADELAAVITRIGARVRQDMHAGRTEILRRTLAGLAVEDWRIAKYLPFERLSAALLRFGGLPSRFGAAAGEPEALPDREALLDADIWPCPGRDSRETAFFCSEELTRAAAFRRAVSAVAASGALYSTLVFTSAPFSLSACAQHMTALRHTLDCAISPGVTQVISGEPATPVPSILDAPRDSRIDFLLLNASYQALEGELRSLAEEWERDRRPLVAVAAALRQVAMKAVKSSGNPGGVPAEEIEIELDDLLLHASGYADLATGAGEIVRRIAGVDVRRDGDVPALHAAIVRYVEQNCAEALTLQSVCDRFRVSQSSVSRLFRRFERASFIEFLTRRRVAMAQRLIGEHPEMPLKDVAAYVGYPDPFYFSRVFKSVTGVPPSEWAARKREA